MPATLSEIRNDEQLRDRDPSLWAIRMVVSLSNAPTYLGGIVAIINEMADLISADPDNTNDYIARARASLPGEMESSVERLHGLAIGLNGDYLADSLTPGGIQMIRPTDEFGQAIPEPGKAPFVFGTADTPAVLRTAMALLYLNGDSELEKRDPIVDRIRGNRVADSVARVREFRDDVSLRRQKPGSWKSRASRAFARFAKGLSAAVRSIFRKFEDRIKAQAEVRVFVRKRAGILGKRGAGTLGSPSFRRPGVNRDLQLIMRQRTLEEMERDRQIDLDKIPRQLLLGYELRSAFSEDTRPSHAARDGVKFYRDNRAGSYLPWSQRIVPPYAYNCLCTTRLIYDNPEHPFVPWEATPRLRGAKVIESHDVGARTFDPKSQNWRRITSDEVGTTIGNQDGVRLAARDVKSYAEWFDVQSPSTKASLVGARRMAAVQSTGVTKPRYQDLTDTDGRFLSARAILREPRRARRRRRRAVSRAIRRQSAAYQKAFREGHSKHKFSRDDERNYRKRLDILLSRSRDFEEIF